jgi:hypothetical protein
VSGINHDIGWSLARRRIGAQLLHWKYRAFYPLLLLANHRPQVKTESLVSRLLFISRKKAHKAQIVKFSTSKQQPKPKDSLHAQPRPQTQLHKYKMATHLRDTCSWSHVGHPTPFAVHVTRWQVFGTYTRTAPIKQRTSTDRPVPIYSTIAALDNTTAILANISAFWSRNFHWSINT